MVPAQPIAQPCWAIEEVNAFDRLAGAALLGGPGAAAVGGVDDGAVETGGPTHLPDEADIEEVFLGSGRAFLPGLAGVVGTENQAAVADGDAAVHIQEGKAPQSPVGAHVAGSPGGAVVRGEPQGTLRADGVSC